jgi:hypothetical protein
MSEDQEKPDRRVYHGDDDRPAKSAPAALIELSDTAELSLAQSESTRLGARVER